MVETTIEMLGFSASHFVHTGDKSQANQRLHGHNYTVGIVLRGAIDQKGNLCSLDALRMAIARYDHKVLVSKNCVVSKTTSMKEGESGKSRLVIENPNTEACYVLPEDDCLVLDIPVTTVECLAKAIAQDIIELKFSIQEVVVTLSAIDGVSATISETRRGCMSTVTSTPPTRASPAVKTSTTSIKVKRNDEIDSDPLGGYVGIRTADSPTVRLDPSRWIERKK